MGSLRLEMNLAALAAAILAARPVPAGAAPVLGPVGLSSRPARFADTTGGWFSYWTRELGLPAKVDRESWRWAAALQALYEAGLLRRGVRIGLDGSVSAGLGDYLRRLDTVVLSGADEELQGWLGAGASRPPVLSSFARPARAIWIGDLSFVGRGSATAPDREALENQALALSAAGWSVSPLDFDLGDDPLDGYVAAVEDGAIFPGGSPPSLRVASQTAFTTPYILIVDRRA